MPGNLHVRFGVGVGVRVPGLHLSFSKTSSEGDRVGRHVGMKRMQRMAKERCRNSNTKRKRGLRVSLRTGCVKHGNEEKERGSPVMRHAACTDAAIRRLAEWR